MRVSLVKRRRSVCLGNIWVCQCCALIHANGECCPDDDHGGDGIEPWSAKPDEYSVTAGLLASEHNGNCEVYKLGAWPVNYECDCERIEFSGSSCDGCGSHLAGSRYAHSYWLD